VVSTDRSEAESWDESAVEEAVCEEGHGRDGVDDGEDVVELEWPVARAVVRLVHVPERRVPQRSVRPPRPELHPDLRGRGCSSRPSLTSHDAKQN
jgi:hypothetical protein